MDMPRSIGLALAQALRVVHIALWLTIPTTFWLWLVNAPPPAECAVEYDPYKANALCASENDFFFTFAGLFLLGFIAFSLWLAGYIMMSANRIAHGDRALPPVQLRVLRAGCVLVGPSLRYWLPFVAGFIAAHAIHAKAYPRYIENALLEALFWLFALVLSWGYFVGVARCAASGDRSLVYRRRENIRLAVTNIKATTMLTLLLFAATKLALIVWKAMVDAPVFIEGLDHVAESAIGSFAFFCLLIAWTIACSHLIARYARKIGIDDHLKDSEPLG